MNVILLSRLKRYKYVLGIAIILFSLIIYKLKFLSLPYYWDEAWPYSKGVNIMYEHNLSLLPGSVPPFIARGHPLMFHFLAAAWMKIFGNTFIAVHSFCLLVSILLIITVYFFCKEFFSERIGFVATVLFASQATFIAQSAFLLPEMMMALWAMLCLYTFFKQKKIWFIIIATIMLLTKESGTIVIATLMCSELVIFIFLKQTDKIGFFKNVLLILVPFMLAALYFIDQKIMFGWFLYPFYMDYIAGAGKKIAEVLPNAAAYLLIYFGRNAISILIIIGAITTIVSKEKNLFIKKKEILIALSIFIGFFLLFSSVNYYIPRYLLCILPPFIIIGAVLADRIFYKFNVVYSVVIIGLIFTNIFFYLTNKTGIDLDYSPSVITDMQMVNFCERTHLQDAHIFAPSVLRIDFSEPTAGYLSGKPFSSLQWEFENNTEYCIFSSDEYDKALFENINSGHQLILMKKIQQNNAWCNIYKVIK